MNPSRSLNWSLALRSQEGSVTHVGFGFLAVLWLMATLQAFAAVTLRLYLPLSQAAGIPFPDANQAVAWLCWVPNLVVAEWVVLRRRSGDGPVAA